MADDRKERFAEGQHINGQEGRPHLAQQDAAKAESKGLYGYLAAVYHLHGQLKVRAPLYPVSIAASICCSVPCAP